MANSAFSSKFALDFKPLLLLTDQCRQNLLRRAIRRGANIGKDKIKAKAPAGDYQKSVAVKVSAKADGRVYAVTGPRSSYQGSETKQYHGETAPQTPVRYAWWLEKGRASGNPMKAQNIIGESIDFPAADTVIRNYLRSEFDRITGR